MKKNAKIWLITASLFVPGLACLIVPLSIPKIPSRAYREIGHEWEHQIRLSNPKIDLVLTFCQADAYAATLNIEEYFYDDDGHRLRMDAYYYHQTDISETRLAFYPTSNIESVQFYDANKDPV